jgi:hypothetical protein
MGCVPDEVNPEFRAIDKVDSPEREAPGHEQGDDR